MENGPTCAVGAVDDFVVVVFGMNCVYTTEMK